MMHHVAQVVEAAFAIIGIVAVSVPIVIVVLGGRALRRIEEADRRAHIEFN